MPVAHRAPRLRLILVAVGVAVLTLAAYMPSAHAFDPPETGRWHQQTPGVAPPARFGAAIGYDEANVTAGMFGGCGATTSALVEVSHTEPNVHTHNQNIGWCTNQRSDTWVWNANQWTQVAGGPTGRYTGTLAYDYTADALVLFGGAAWTVTDTANPTPPAGSERCLHAITHLKILEGTYVNKYLNFYCFKDTWYLKKVSGVWTWTQKTPVQSPPARFDNFGASDGDGKVVIGLGCSKIGTMRFKEPQTDPSSYYFECFHRDNGATETTGYRRDAWVWTHATNTWARVAANAAADAQCLDQNLVVPTCRRGVVGTYNSATDGVFIFGAFMLRHDPLPLEPLRHTYGANNFPNDNVWQWDNAWLRTCRTSDPMCNTQPPLPPQSPGIRAFASAATVFWNGAWRPFVFGGRGGDGTGAAFNNDMYLWQDEPFVAPPRKGDWIGVCTSATAQCITKPSPRAGTAMTYIHGAAGYVLAFGGLNAAGTILADTWTFGAPSPPGSVPCPLCSAIG